MAVAKVQLGDGIELDLTNDSVAAEHLEAGYTAHGKNGEPINGSLVVQRYYTGSSDPSSSLGNNGDLYLKV